MRGKYCSNVEIKVNSKNKKVYSSNTFDNQIIRLALFLGYDVTYVVGSEAKKLFGKGKSNHNGIELASDDRYFKAIPHNPFNNGGSIDIYAMDPYEFEAFITYLLGKYGYKNVVRIGAAGDRGVDIIATNPKGTKSIFQCKRWQGGVGGTPIQRLHSLKTVNSEITEAVCITTSYYTTQGKQEAKATGVEIIDGIGLMERVEAKFPKKYYNSAISSSKDIVN